MTCLKKRVFSLFVGIMTAIMCIVSPFSEGLMKADASTRMRLILSAATGAPGSTITLKAVSTQTVALKEMTGVYVMFDAPLQPVSMSSRSEAMNADLVHEVKGNNIYFTLKNGSGTAKTGTFFTIDVKIPEGTPEGTYSVRWNIASYSTADQNGNHYDPRFTDGSITVKNGVTQTTTKTTTTTATTTSKPTTTTTTTTSKPTTTTTTTTIIIIMIIIIVRVGVRVGARNRRKRVRERRMGRKVRRNEFAVYSSFSKGRNFQLSWD
ncbi:MAG: hypothetical protein IJN14_02500 [Ruminococcus sp.]|nr:hypothetical protein [Ruminococcus sp.]